MGVSEFGRLLVRHFTGRVEAQRAAGIEMVCAAENSGPSCSTVIDPPAIYDASYTIGALNTGTDTIASFSSAAQSLPMAVCA
jgi:hypothetical protein